MIFRDVGQVMSERQDPEPGAFEAFRRAEELVSAGRPLDALRELRLVMDAEPDSPNVMQLAGRAYLNSAQFGRAEQAFRRLVERDPSDHYALFALGKTLQRQGRLTEAVARLRLAVAMNPLPEYQEALGEVSTGIALRAKRNSDGLTG